MVKDKQSIRNVLDVQGKAVTIITRANKDYISLTDIAKYRNQEEPFSIINNWMRNRSTIEFLGLWEKLNNNNFKPIEFERFKKEINGMVLFIKEFLRRQNDNWQTAET